MTFPVLDSFKLFSIDNLKIGQDEAYLTHAEILTVLLKIKEKKATSREIATLGARLKEIDKESLDAILKEFSVLLIESGSLDGLERALALIPEEKMKLLLPAKEEGLKETKELAKEIFESLKNLEMKAHKTSSSTIGSMFMFVIRFFQNIIDTFLIAFTLFDIGKDPQSAWEASAMLDVYYKFFMIPTLFFMCVKLFIPVISWPAVVITSGAILLILSFLIIYVKFLRPCPDRLPHCDANYSLEAALGKIQPVLGREKEIDEIIQILSSAQGRSKKHVLLTGKTGVGKTEIVKGVAYKIASKSYEGPLKSRKIFHVNTASLVQGGMYGYADQMSFLLNRIRKVDKVILFFDEIHVALKNQSNLSNFLKPILDKKNVLCIAATTDLEFEEYLGGGKTDTKEKTAEPGDHAFLRRFKQIKIEEIDNQSIKAALEDQAGSFKPLLEFEKSAFEEIISQAQKQFPKETSPDRELTTFSIAAGKFAKTFEPCWIPVELENLKIKRERLALEYANSFKSKDPLSSQNLKKIRNLKKIKEDIAAKEIKLAKVKKLLELFKVSQKIKKEMPCRVKADSFKVLSSKNKTVNNLLLFDLLFLSSSCHLAMERIGDKLKKYQKIFKEIVCQKLTKEVVAASFGSNPDL